MAHLTLDRNTLMTKQVTAEELQTADPRRFEKEYSKWVEWQWDDMGYVEDIQAQFHARYAPMGIDITDLHYSLGYCQSDFASFDGRVNIAEWMKVVPTCPDGPTYAERYPALYLAWQGDGGYMTIYGAANRRGWRADYQDDLVSNIAPCGIFANMPEEDWEALLIEQISEADLEREVLEYCKAIGRELYDSLVDSYESVTSEDAFIESCEAYEVTFEIELEGDGDEVCSEH